METLLGSPPNLVAHGGLCGPFTVKHGFPSGVPGGKVHD